MNIETSRNQGGLERVSQPPFSTDALVVSEQDAKPYTGLSGRTLQRLRLEGRGPCFVRLTGNRIGYRVSDLQAWVAERLVTSTSDATVRSIGGAV